MKETFKEFCARILPIVKAGAEGMSIEVTGDKKQWMPVNDDCGAIRKKVAYRIVPPVAPNAIIELIERLSLLTGRSVERSASQDSQTFVIRNKREIDTAEIKSELDELAKLNAEHYRAEQPKATPLPITPEMWAMIDPKYKFACLNSLGDVFFSAVELGWGEISWRFNEPFDNYLKSPLIINTTGIIPELSLTKRPEQSDSLDAWTYCKQDGERMQDAFNLIQKQFVRSYAPKSGGGTYSDDEIKELKKSVRDGLNDGAKAALKELSANVISRKFTRHITEGGSVIDYLVIEHINPITGATQTMRFKIK